ncbi:MAG TPA: tRNA (cytidine(34)-2'-O)-methyltransferase [Nitrospiria bacterium]|nr:tRNA (cytidine(34)-2'-O)-methyltransferase [Nitrospiria bacterium]
MFRVVLHHPEIPANSGNIIRLCANTGAELHLIEPLGFQLDDARLRRAGLDYHDRAALRIHASLDEFLSAVKPPRVFACSTRGRRPYADAAFQPGDALLFGSETHGLPAAIRQATAPECLLRIPMIPNNRSLNLSNAVALVLYEAWRQHGFAGSTDAQFHT